MEAMATKDFQKPTMEVSFRVPRQRCGPMAAGGVIGLAVAFQGGDECADALHSSRAYSASVCQRPQFNCVADESTQPTVGDASIKVTPCYCRAEAASHAVGTLRVGREHAPFSPW